MWVSGLLTPLIVSYNHVKLYSLREGDELDFILYWISEEKAALTAFAANDFCKPG